MVSLGKYELHEPLGKGGFGTVYRATDPMLKRIVAIKVLHPQMAVDAEFLERFRREAQVVAALDHPNIVGIYEIGESEGRFFIAMKYLPGGSLADLIQRGPLPYPRALEIMAQMCEGLQEMHALGWVHRDLKPANILFDGRGRAVISDFGLARALVGASGSSSSAGGVGTPFYRPPELWLGKPPASPATDVYSLGCILGEMLTGTPLFPGDTPDQVLAKHFMVGPDFGPGWPPADAPAQVAAVVSRTLAKDPAERYPDAIGFLQALQTCAQKSAPVEVQQPEPAEEEKRVYPETRALEPPVVENPPPNPAPEPPPGEEKQLRELPTPEPPRPVGPRVPRWAVIAVVIVLGTAVLAVAVYGGSLFVQHGSAPAKPAVSASQMQAPEPTPTAGTILIDAPGTLTRTPTYTATATKVTPTSTRTPRPTPTLTEAPVNMVIDAQTVTKMQSAQIQEKVKNLLIKDNKVIAGDACDSNHGISPAPVSLQPDTILVLGNWVSEKGWCMTSNGTVSLPDQTKIGEHTSDYLYLGEDWDGIVDFSGDIYAYVTSGKTKGVPLSDIQKIHLMNIKSGQMDYVSHSNAYMNGDTNYYDWINGIKISPNQEFIFFWSSISGYDSNGNASNNNSIFVKNFVSGGSLYHMFQDKVINIDFLPEPDTVIIATTAEILKWNYKTGETTRNLYKTANGMLISSFALSKSKKLMAIGKEDGQVEIVDLADWQKLATKISGSESVTNLAFSNDDRLLASINAQYVAMIWFPIP
jgi:serine/threonine protein kinase